MTRLRPVWLVVPILVTACLPSPELPPETVERLESLVADVPAEHEQGRATYDEVCAQCHGSATQGSSLGPPLAHKVYKPSHHGDVAFTLAVQRGVRAHHWRFGDMPSFPRVSEEDTNAVTAYIRWLQRGVGIE